MSYYRAIESQDTSTVRAGLLERAKKLFSCYLPCIRGGEGTVGGEALKMKVELARLMQQHRVAPKSCTAIAPLPPVPYDTSYSQRDR